MRRWRRLNAKHRRTVRRPHGARHEHRIPAVPDARRALAAAARGPAHRRPARPRVARRRRESASRRYALKAAREAKTRTSWVEPNADVRARARRVSSRPILEPRRRRAVPVRTWRGWCRASRRSARRTRCRGSPFTSRRPARRTSIRATSSGTSRSSIRTTGGRSTTTREQGARELRRRRRRCATDGRSTCSTIASSCSSRIGCLQLRRSACRRCSRAGRIGRSRSSGPRARHVVAFARCARTTATCVTVVSRDSPDHSTDWQESIGGAILLLNCRELDSDALAVADLRCDVAGGTDGSSRRTARKTSCRRSRQLGCRHRLSP